MNTHALGPSDDRTHDTRPLLDLMTGVLSVGQNGLKLTKAEQAVFARLAQSPGQVPSRERLYDALYGARAGLTGMVETVWGARVPVQRTGAGHRSQPHQQRMAIPAHRRRSRGTAECRGRRRRAIHNATAPQLAARVAAVPD